MDIRQLAKQSYKESNYSKDNPMYWHLWKRAFDRAWMMFEVEAKDQRICELKDLLLKLKEDNMCSVVADEMIDKLITPNPSKTDKV